MLVITIAINKDHSLILITSLIFMVENQVNTDDKTEKPKHMTTFITFLFTTISDL